jgi:hypothetical protein
MVFCKRITEMKKQAEGVLCLVHLGPDTPYFMCQQSATDTLPCCAIQTRSGALCKISLKSRLSWSGQFFYLSGFIGILEIISIWHSLSANTIYRTPRVLTFVSDCIYDGHFSLLVSENSEGSARFHHRCLPN